MKSAKEWTNEAAPSELIEFEDDLRLFVDEKLIKFILAIQQDAIQAAAGVCRAVMEDYDEYDRHEAGPRYGAERCNREILSLLPEART